MRVVHSGLLAQPFVVVTTGDLDGAAALVAFAVSGLGVAEVGPTLVGASERTPRRCGRESDSTASWAMNCLSDRRVDAVACHRVVQRGDVLSDLLGLDTGHNAYQIVRGDSGWWRRQGGSRGRFCCRSRGIRLQSHSPQPSPRRRGFGGPAPKSRLPDSWNRVGTEETGSALAADVPTPTAVVVAVVIMAAAAMTARKRRECETDMSRAPSGRSFGFGLRTRPPALPKGSRCSLWITIEWP